MMSIKLGGTLVVDMFNSAESGKRNTGAPRCQQALCSGLVATREFSLLGASATPEARIILGAAVMDDVLGLLLLAVLTAAGRAGGMLSITAIAVIFAKAVGFLMVRGWLRAGTAALSCRGPSPQS
jgi:hypothetical protein